MLIQISGVQRQVIISLCLYLGQMICGFSLSWTGPIIPKLRDLEQSPIPYSLSEAQLSLVATCIYIGGILGPYITIWLSNTKGRKPCLICGGVLMVGAYTILATAKSLAMLYLGRGLKGVACGIVGIMILVYIGEIASTNIRGSLLTAVGIFTTLGSILLFSVGPFISFSQVNYIGVALNLVFVFCALWIPETPIFYLIKDKDAEVITTLEKLGRLEDKDKLLEMKKNLTESSSKKDWMEMVTIKSNRKALAIVIIINILQHCSGVLGIIFFSAAIFEMAGSPISSNIAMIIIGCFQLTGSTVTPFFVERVGRKKILLMSSALCALSMFILGLYFYLDRIGNSVVDSIKWLPLLILILYFIGYDSGLGIIPTALIGEMFTSKVRSIGSTVTMTTSWLFGFMVTTAFGALLETVGGHVAFWFFTGTCACSFLFTLFFIPETKGKTLLEIQEALS